jgi:nucleotide-binding universal stress UspA family protein
VPGIQLADDQRETEVRVNAMFGRILLPLDGSKTAENAMPYALALAGGLKLPVDLLAVVDIAELAAHLSAAHARYMDTIVEAEVKSINEYLGGVAKSFKETAVTSAVKKGRADEVIITEAAADKSTLIVMATHGRSGINRWLMGSVAEKILRSTANPLLLVRAGKAAIPAGDVGLKSVIVPLDGSQLAEAALPAVIELGKALNLEIMLLRTYELPASAHYSGDYVPDFEALRARIRREAQGYLEGKIAALNAQGLRHVFSAATEGPAADEIVKYTLEHPESLVAMCTHGRSGVRRWVLGSVTEKVVRHSGSPVLVISAKAASRAGKQTVPDEFGAEVSGAMRYTID